MVGGIKEMFHTISRKKHIIMKQKTPILIVPQFSSCPALPYIKHHSPKGLKSNPRHMINSTCIIMNLYYSKIDVFGKNVHENNRFWKKYPLTVFKKFHLFYLT